MSIIQLYTEEVSTELTAFLQEIKPNVDRYVEAKNSAQKERMLIIGKVSEYREQFPQRSGDHRLLSQAMNREWSSDVIKKNVGAYKAFKQLQATEVPEYIAVAEKASPSQLLALGRADGTKLAYDAAQHLKKTGELPSSQVMRRHQSTEKCAGAPLNANPSQSQQTSTSHTPYVAPAQPQLTEEELQLQRYGITDESQRHHILSLIANENLAHITTVRDAYLWHLLGGGSLQALVPIIKQKLSQSKEFEVLLRELVLHHTAIEVTATEVPTTFDNAMHDGIRWRR
jgi:hypothetical protein